MEEMTALGQQQDELGALLDGLDASEWDRPTRCPGWTVADVVLHLAQTNEMAIGSATGRFDEVLAVLAAGAGPARDVDEGAARMVDRERGAAPAELRTRWRVSAAALLDALRTGDQHERVQWVAGTLSLRTLATTRLAETWIHTGDVAEALDVELTPGPRLRHVARLAWRTLPYAFARAGRALGGPVAFELTGPGGEAWRFVPDEDPVTTISGDGVELCLVAARRLDASRTALRGEGPDAEAVLGLVRTYA